MDDVANAVERAQSWIERGVLPHYAQYWRGGGAEMAVRLVRDTELLGDPTRLRTQPTVLRRRWAARLCKDIRVSLDLGPARGASWLVMGHGWHIQLAPRALFAAGFRDSAEIDDAVLRILLARYVQAVSAGRFRPPRDDDPASWEHAIASARAADTAHIVSRATKFGMWSLVAAAIITMVTAGYLGL